MGDFLQSDERSKKVKNIQTYFLFCCSLFAMVFLLQLVGKPSKRFLFEDEWLSLPYPSDFATKMRELFFSKF